MTIVMLVIGIICLLVTPVVGYLYVLKVKKEKAHKGNFKIKDAKVRYEIFHFWSHVLYIFIMFTLIIASLVLLAVSIGNI